MRIPKSVLLLCIFSLFGQLLIGQNNDKNTESNKQFDLAFKIKFTNPDSAIYIFNEYFENQMNEGDTLEAIKSLIHLGEIYGHYNYSKSYNLLWTALILADEIDDNIAKAEIYNGIAGLYHIYKRKDEALYYYQLSVTLNHNLINQGIIDKHELIHDYFSLVIYYRELGEINQAKKYLDSCHIISEAHHPGYFINSEAAFIDYIDGNITRSRDSLIASVTYFEKVRPSYLTIIYSFLGDIYKDLKDFKNSEAAYLSSIKYADQYHSHQDYKIDVLKKLSDLYYTYAQYNKAYEYLLVSSQLNQELFGSKSSGNRQLLEIQDKYRLSKEYQKDLLQEKRIAELEHEERVWYFKNIILLGSIVFIIIFGLLFIRTIRLKHKSSRQKINLEMRKAHEILEIKNRELAASTIQIIEKEKILQEIKNRLKEEKDSLNPNDLEKIAKSIHTNSEGGWEEFETRFTAVNESFYDTLHEKFPNLTQGDHRLCALIKLNFSSKEMSNLLGISVESVHSSRYKLRKKLGLTREQNLTEFIAKL